MVNLWHTCHSGLCVIESSKRFAIAELCVSLSLQASIVGKLNRTHSRILCVPSWGASPESRHS